MWDYRFYFRGGGEYDVWYLCRLIDFNLWCFLTYVLYEILIYNKNCMYNFVSSIPLS